MDLKGSSTVLDTVVFVLLVGAAVAILAGSTPQEPDAAGRVADETADVLATSTTTVTYTRSGTVSQNSPLRVVGAVAEGQDPSNDRTIHVTRRAHGTYAELLAAAVVANPRLGTRSLTGSGHNMTTVVANATRSALPPEETNVEVRATWRPYPNSLLGRTIAVGDPPPDDADVSVATVTVASGFPNVTGDLPADPSYDLVAAAVAEAVIEGLFPPDRTRDALASEGPDRAIVAERYATASASDALNADTEGYLAEGEVESANDALAARLAARLRPELVATFDSPTAAVRALSVDRVRIVVRTWST